ncbi:microfibril-associated glycoprotein 4-like [Boleophthalmus pectinirostris]|uniref:microfibril-associated glycoprotein 4-like n=1 Tax=Boleophthalmus pectinirostris TaxID=150288 RepID=UPI0024315E5E|nr:microfibril-associated glycoprotein 4-like [Boleophthalmus pectinirostris]XP_055017651.1 microfibril-associated glycoprotein 4-like [Boleophthalmus pectinirostris]
MTAVLVLMFVAPLLTCSRADDKPVDCSQILKQNPGSASGVYTIYPFLPTFPVMVYCDMETNGGGWSVIQRRMDGTVNFYRGWEPYVMGFGKADGEYWLGLEFIHKITARGKHELLVEMEDFDGKKASALYTSFSVEGDCNGYKLNVSGFVDGGAGDSLSYHNNQKFTTFDNDQDNFEKNCAKLYLGAFWYDSCHFSNPNGIYRWGLDPSIFAIGIEWKTWKGYNYSVKSISLKTRPVP